MGYNSYMCGFSVDINRIDNVFLTRQERKLQKRTRRIFLKQLAWCVKIAKKFDYEKNTTNKEIDDEIDKMILKETLAKSIVASMAITFARSIKKTIKDKRLGRFGVSYTAVNEEAKRFLKNKLSHELSNKKGTISKNTIVRISKIIKNSIKTGKSYNETAKLIMQQGEAGVFSPARAKLIAIRETGVAYGNGNYYAMLEFQRQNPKRKVLKRWITVRDNKVTDKCKDNRKQSWIKLKTKFSSGDTNAPRDDHPRCRCDTGYDILGPGK